MVIKIVLFSRYFKNRISIIAEFIPQIIFLVFLFFYMVILMFIKWLKYFANVYGKFLLKNVTESLALINTFDRWGHHRRDQVCPVCVDNIHQYGAQQGDPVRKGLRDLQHVCWTDLFTEIPSVLRFYLYPLDASR